MPNPTSTALVTTDWLEKAFKWGYDKLIREQIAAEVAKTVPWVTLRRLDEWLESMPGVKEEVERGAAERDLRDVALLETGAMAIAMGQPPEVREGRRVPDGKGGATIEPAVVIPGRLPDGKLALDLLERRNKDRWDKKAPPPPPQVSKTTVVVINNRLRGAGMRSLEEIVGDAERLEPPA